MQREIRADQLADLTVDTKPLPLSAAQLRGARRGCRTSRAVEARAVLRDARLPRRAARQRRSSIGVPDFARQQRRRRPASTSGAAPGAGEALTDAQNARQGRYDGEAGDRAPRASRADGSTRALRISGEGRNMAMCRAWSPTGSRRPLRDAGDRGGAVRQAAGSRSLAFRLDDPSRAAATATVAAVAAYLRASTRPSPASPTCRRARARRLARARSMFEQVLAVLYGMTALALLSALVLLVEHDDDAGRRADAGDRPDEGDRRHRAARSRASTCAPR